MSASLLAFGQNNKDNTADYPELTGFSKLDINLAANVYIRQSDSFRCRIEGSKSTLAEIYAHVKNGVLNIHRDKHNWIGGIERVTIIIEAPNFEDINFSGAGKLITENKLTGNKLHVEVNGAANMILDSVDYQDIAIELSGVGNISISGKALSSTMEMSGTGNIDAFDLIVEKARCETSGVGNINCFVNEELNAYVSGIGGIRYKGTPKSLRKSVSGIGKVMNRN